MRRLVLALFLVFGCSGSQRAEEHRDRAVLVIESSVADAVLWVDGRYIAQLGDLPRGVPLPPGRHQVEIRHDRYFAHYAEVDLVKGRPTRLRIELAEILP